MNASLMRSVDNVLFVPLRSLSRVARRSLNNTKRAGWKRKVIINLMQPLLGWCDLYTVQRVTTSAATLYLAMKTLDCFQRQLLELSITAAALNVKQGPPSLQLHLTAGQFQPQNIPECFYCSFSP